MDNSFVRVKTGRLLLLGPGCWLLLLLRLMPVLARNPQRMLLLGLLLLLLLLLGVRTGPVPCRVGFPKSCLPLLGIYGDSCGYWRGPVEWRRDPVWRRRSWDIVSGVRWLLLVGSRIGSGGEGGHRWRCSPVSQERSHETRDSVPTLVFILQDDGQDCKLFASVKHSFI